MRDSNGFAVEGLEGRTLFAAAVVLSAGEFSALLGLTDTNADGRVSATEARARVTVIKGQIKDVQREYSAAVKEAKGEANEELRELKSFLKEELREAEDAEERQFINEDYRESVRDVKESLKETLADLKSGLNDELATLRPGEALLGSLAKALAKPFVGDADGDGQLTRGNGEVEALLGRDGVGDSLSARDFKNINRVPKR